MDPITCCLLGICCPPARRLDRITEHYRSLGLSEGDARAVAEDLVTRFDALLRLPLLQSVIDAARKHKD